MGCEKLAPGQLACLEALHNQQHNLEQTIHSLLNILQSLPEGEIRSKLLLEISCLNSIRDVMERALSGIQK
jgi:hypothetical protein